MLKIIINPCVENNFLIYIILQVHSNRKQNICLTLNMQRECEFIILFTEHVIYDKSQVFQ